MLRMLLLAACFALLGACGGNEKKLNERVTLKRTDKIPYGTWYAYEELKHLFPQAKSELNKRSPEHHNGWVSNFEDPTAVRPRSAYIVIAPTVWMEDEELDAILEYVGKGNHVFLSAIDFSTNLLDSLKLIPARGSGYANAGDSLTVSVLNPETSEKTQYTYPGKQLDNYLSRLDTNYTNILGYDYAGRPNFVRFTYKSGGSIAVHFAPTSLTNFFLLHKDNKSYYDNALSYLPEDVRLIEWDDYYRLKGPSSGKAKFSAFQWLIKQPPLAIALWLLLLLFLIIYLFESKRKQRIIPTIVPPKNASLDFVKTIGRLYYQRRDNKNLVGKMIMHFLDHVRTKYNVNTSSLDEQFEHRLAYKTGIDAARVKELIEYIKVMEARPMISDEALMEFNKRLENFYKLS